MKHVAAFTCLGALYTGALWIEYRTALLLGTSGVLFGVGSALALLANALYRAPEGDERADAFYVRARNRRATAFRYVRFSQPARARR